MLTSTQQVADMTHSLRNTASTLDAIAQNQTYDEAALRDALAQPNLPVEMKVFLKGYIKGLRESMSHVRLNEVAIWLREQK
jgi:hypothetical protein